MQKFLSFLAMGAIVLGMASCGGNEGNNPEPKNYKVEVKSVTRHEISVKVTANDKTKYFYCDILDLKTFLDDTEKRVQTTIETTVKMAKFGNPDLAFPALLYQDFAERVFKDLTAGTDYAIFMCVVDEDYKIVGDIEYTIISTEAQTTLPDRFVKCQTLWLDFIPFYLYTNPEWYFDTQKWNLVSPGNGTMLCINMPGTMTNYSNKVYTIGEIISYGITEMKVSVSYSKKEGDKWIIEKTYAIDGGTIKVTQNTDESYTFDLDLSFDEIGSYKGVITGIRIGF